MKKEDRKGRFSLTLLFAGVIMVFMLISLAVAGIIGYFLIKSNVISVTNGADMDTSKVIFLLAINSLILGAILSSTASKIPLKPINKIISQMNRLASGDFSARLDFKGPLANHPTTREITDSFNKMAEELESTEMLRGDFINNFSHEFKTPIVSIAGFAKLLKRGNLTEEQKKEYIDIIEEESLRLSAMATNVLNLTKYENQSILTDISRFNLSEEIRSSILALEVKWAKKDVEFNLDFSELMIEGNKDMLKHVWLNIIDNAIKFSDNGTSVDIRIQEIGERYAISISNHGVEIPTEQQAKIFNKFYQADESHASEGNGIGLAVVKGITKLHKGNVTVLSKDGVITFTVTLPKKQQI